MLRDLYEMHGEVGDDYFRMSAFIQPNSFQILSHNKQIAGFKDTSNINYVRIKGENRRRGIIPRYMVSQEKNQNKIRMSEEDANDFPLPSLQKNDDIPTDRSQSQSEKTSTIADSILQDMNARPEYYTNMLGVFFGTALGLVVMSAILNTLNHLPLLPDVLKIIGLGYTFWFLREYLTVPEARSQLKKDVDGIVANVRGRDAFEIKDDDEKSAESEEELREEDGVTWMEVLANKGPPIK